MDSFVQGVLTVEDEMYILDPDMRVASGEMIHMVYLKLRPRKEQLEGEDDPLSLLLEVNQWYELLLVAQVGLGGNKVTYSSDVPSGTRLELVSTEIQMSSGVKRRNDVVQGIILDLNWDVASQHYLAIAGSALYTRRFVLIETAIGKMVLSYKALQDQLGEQVEQLALGGYLEWKPRTRMDLLAIIAKRDPEPGERRGNANDTANPSDPDF